MALSGGSDGQVFAVNYGLAIVRQARCVVDIIGFKNSGKRLLTECGTYFHSDRGAENVANRYQQWLKKQGATQSMNRKIVMNDNAEMESFFHSLKVGRAHKQRI